MGYPGGEPEDGEFEDPWEAEGQLALSDEDDRLPWLESDDDGDEGGVDTGRIVTVAVIGLAVVLALVGAGWFLTREGDDPAIVADGSTIASPGPYKSKPDDPGGRQVEGTGDVSFQVAEGETKRGVLSGEDEVRPSIDRNQPEDVPTPTPTPTASGTFVQIGAYDSKATAEESWIKARDQYPVLSGMSHRVVEAEVNGLTVFRLQAIAGDRDGGEATCRAIRNAGGDCYIRR